MGHNHKVMGSSPLRNTSKTAGLGSAVVFFRIAERFQYRETTNKENSMQEYTPFKEGKVREIYDIGDSLIMVSTDRISAFAA